MSAPVHEGTNPSANSGAPALVIRDLHVTRGKQPVLRGVNITASAGQVWAVMGVSGAGKTTVLRCIAALQPFNQGHIAIGPVSLHPGPVPAESKLHGLRQQVGVVFQQGALFEHLSVLENITLAPVHALGWTRERANSVATTLLASLGVQERAGALPRELSGGEAQRVAIARALAPGPRLLLMDEPTSALDPARRGALGELLRSLAAEGRAIFIVTHDVDFARCWTDRVVVLAEGTVVEEGPARQVLEQGTHSATRALLSQSG